MVPETPSGRERMRYALPPSSRPPEQKWFGGIVVAWLRIRPPCAPWSKFWFGVPWNGLRSGWPSCTTVWRLEGILMRERDCVMLAVYVLIVGLGAVMERDSSALGFGQMVVGSAFLGLRLWAISRRRNG